MTDSIITDTHTMVTKQRSRTTSLEALIDKHVGARGTRKREVFENELRMDLLGDAIRNVRLERKLTQEQLGDMVGVGKAQISKIENSVKNARLDTVLRVFAALGTSVSFSVEKR
jgi:DNA-binding XRE family transcriptional regulator